TSSVANSVSSITLTPTASSATATIKVNGTAVISGEASGAINLTVADNTISTVVTAEDGTTIQTYTLVVTRAPSADASLSAIALSSAVLTLSPYAALFRSTSSVANSVSSITLTPTASSATATIKVNGTAVISGEASG